MEEQNQTQIIIGIRGEAKQALTAAILLIPLTIILCAFVGVLLPLTFNNGDFSHYFETPSLYFFIFAAAFLAAAIYGITNNFIHAFRNNKMLPKPVLVYDSERDAFIGYLVRKNNKQVVIKNGNVIGMSGSAAWTSRELTIRYKDENGKVRRESFGFARNIDNGVLRNKFNHYSKNKI